LAGGLYAGHACLFSHKVIFSMPAIILFFKGDRESLNFKVFTVVAIDCWFFFIIINLRASFEVVVFIVINSRPRCFILFYGERSLLLRAAM
jgi:hypothetical protein